MFTLKASSEQKWVKRTQERETVNVVSVHFTRRNILRHGELWTGLLRQAKYFPPWRAMT